MKLLRIKANRYKNLSDDLTIEFIPIARKSDEDKTYELNEISESLYTFSTTAIIGKNASGKTSVLKLINNVFTVLESFQLPDDIISLDGAKLDITFYHRNIIYRYVVDLQKQSDISNNLSFINEKVSFMNYTKTKANKIFNDDMYTPMNIKRELPDDISLLFYILKERKNYAYYYDDFTNKLNYHNIYNLYEKNGLDKKYWKCILNLFDENIKNLVEVQSDVFKLDYLGKSLELSAKELFNMLSSGTTKGITLYTNAIQALLSGNTFIIDEIENHFHKTLVEYLITLYKDKSVNKYNASLIFSTHYCELLDLFNRNDNIWITKSNNKVNLTNMYKDYQVRNDLLKSKKFYEDNFDTAVSYDALMSLKKVLMDE